MDGYSGMRDPEQTVRKLRGMIKDMEYVSFGFRLGYWPCLKAPYVQIVFAGYRCDFWWGLPSYKRKELWNKKLNADSVDINRSPG